MRLSDDDRVTNARIAHVLRAIAAEWAADPDAVGDTARDFRNDLRERADVFDKGE